MSQTYAKEHVQIIRCAKSENNVCVDFYYV